jgi:hypothetical protein
MRFLIRTSCLLALGASIAACSGGATQGTGGGGGEAGGTGGTGGSPCASLPVELQAPGSIVEVAAASGALTEAYGTRPSVAYSGSVALAVWETTTLFFSRIGPDGEPLDVPARPIDGDSTGGGATVVWDGTRFIVLWVGSNDDGDDTIVRRLFIDEAGAVVPGSESEISELAGVSSLNAVSNGSVTFIVAHDQNGLDVVATGLRLGSDGEPIDATPIEIANSSTSIVWDGSSFVAVYRDPGTLELMGARFNAAGENLDPAGVLLDLPGAWALVGEGNGTVVAFQEGDALQVARLSPALEVVAGPTTLIDFDFENSSVTGVTLSRSSAGQLAIGYTVVDDTDTGTMVTRALGDDLVLVGDAVIGGDTFSERQSLVGVGGLGHLVVRASDPLAAESLSGSATGLVGDGAQSISLAGPVQGSTAVAGSGMEYCVVWEEADAGGSTLRAIRVGLDGVPVGSPMDLGAMAPGIEPHVAWSGARFFVTWTAVDGSLQFSEVMPGADVADTSANLSAGFVITSSVACVGGGCLVSWLEDDRTTVRGQRFDPNGGASPPFTIAQVGWGEADRIAVKPFGTDLAAFWASGAARVTPAGVVTALTGFPGTSEETGFGADDAGSPSMEGVGTPLAASPTTLLAYLSIGGDFSPTTTWVELLNLDGSSAGHIELPATSGGAAATWDGVGFLFNRGDRTLSIAADGSVLSPGDGFQTAALIDGALGSAAPGYSLLVGSRRDEATGVFSIVAQPLNRPDAGCN